MVVCVGVTDTEVPVTAPTVFIEREVAPDTFHDRVVDWPEVMEAGEAENDVIVGAVAAPATVRVVWQVAVPPAPVKVPA